MNEKQNEKNVTTAERVEIILSEIDDSIVADEIRNAFFLENPLGFAKLAYARELPIETMRDLLRLKVGQKQDYAPDMQPLINRAFEQLWKRLGESCRQFDA